MFTTPSLALRMWGAVCPVQPSRTGWRIVVLLRTWAFHYHGEQVTLLSCPHLTVLNSSKFPIWHDWCFRNVPTNQIMWRSIILYPCSVRNNHCRMTSMGKCSFNCCANKGKGEVLECHATPSWIADVQSLYFFPAMCVLILGLCTMHVCYGVHMEGDLCYCDALGWIEMHTTCD